LVEVGQCPPYLGSDALEVGQCCHAGDRPEQEPEPEDGLHLLFLPDPSTGRIVSRYSIVAWQRDMGSMTATRRPANTNEGTRRVRGEPDLYPTTGSHPVHLHQACPTIQGLCPCGHSEALLRARMAEIDSQVAELQAVRGELARVVEQYPAAACPDPTRNIPLV
jgi:hypothetical protein